MNESERPPAETSDEEGAWRSGDRTSERMTSPHPSPAEGGEGAAGGAVARPPRPSQAEGERADEDEDAGG